MTLLSTIVCLLCSLVASINSSGAAPVAYCTGNSCAASAHAPRANSPRVTLALGTVQGTSLDYSAERFTLSYAQPPVGQLRFASPQPPTAFNASVYDASQLPKACMQQPDERYGISADNVSEDCLYLNVYRPSRPSSTTSKLPVIVWVHGGSFSSGASTAPGLDGSWLASQNNIIVVTIQYRLGMFGFFSPSAFTDGSADTSSNGKIQGNQGVRDAIQALRFVHDNMASFGGDPNRITLAGQSSGAHLIRSLLNARSASWLFQQVILHSDPANFGTQTAQTSEQVSDFALQQTGCSDLDCLRSMSANDVLGASTAAVQAGRDIDPSVALTEVWRPFIDSLTGTAFEENPSDALSRAKPIIFTNVENEGGSAVGSLLLPTGAEAQRAQLRSYPISLTRQQLLDQMFNNGRASTLSNASQYAIDSNTSAYPSPAQVQLYSQSKDGLRRNLETVLTQGMFVCPTWNNAQRYAPGTPAYVALFQQGVQYPSNAANDYCSADRRVCHEDDIQLVFVDPSKLTDATKQSVVKEVQDRWVAFVRSGNPNTVTYGGWSTVDADQQTASVLRLGANSASASASSASSSAVDHVALQTGQYAGCGQIWGSQVKFDWQLYG